MITVQNGKPILKIKDHYKIIQHINTKVLPENPDELFEKFLGTKEYSHKIKDIPHMPFRLKQTCDCGTRLLEIIDMAFNETESKGLIITACSGCNKISLIYLEKNNLK